MSVLVFLILAGCVAIIWVNRKHHGQMALYWNDHLRVVPTKERPRRPSFSSFSNF